MSLPSNEIRSPGFEETQRVRSQFIGKIMERVFLFCLMGFLFSVGLWTLHPYLMLQNSDGSIFYTLGKSLATGQGYLLLSLPDPQPYFTFPPLFPLQLAALMKAMGTTAREAIIPAAKGYEMVLFGMSLLLFYGVVRRQFGLALGMALTMLLAVNGTIHRYLGDVLSDVPYLLVSMVSLLAFIRSDQLTQGTEAKRGKLWFGLGLLFQGLSILTRHVGLALGVALIIRYALAKQWRNALLAFLVCGLTFGGWAAYEHLYREAHPMEGVSVNQYLAKSPVKLEFMKHFAVVQTEEEDHLKVAKGPADFLAQAAHRAEQYARMISGDFWPTHHGIPKGITLLFLLLSLGFLGYGAYQLYRDYPLIPLYVGCYLGVLCCYPYISSRFLIPLFPLLIGLYFTGFWGLIRGKNAGSSRKVLLKVGFMILIAVGVQLPDAMDVWQENADIQERDQGPISSVAYRGLYRTYLWTKDHLPANSILYTRKAETFYFYSGLQSKRFPFLSQSEDLYQWFQGEKGKYHPQRPLFILEDQAFKETRRTLKPMLQRYASGLKLRYEEPLSHTRIWEVL